MAKRGAICIGINKAEGMMLLQAAAQGARDFEQWAKSQGCHTKLLVDEDGGEVLVSDIFKAVNEFVQAGTYEQLIIYFSGHGILTAPGTEYWLLSGAPLNPNEAVNLFRSVEDARNSGIPHVVFISDACRSAVKGPPLSGIVGGVIFPNKAISPTRGEIDVFYATRPGDPAWEVPEEEATKRYRGIFTDCLLKAVKLPGNDLIDPLATGPSPVSVITSRRLKPYLETNVPVDAGAVDIRLRQKPEVRVESALPKYFAIAPSLPLAETGDVAPRPPLLRRRSRRISLLPQKAAAKEKAVVRQQVSRLLDTRGRAHFETHTGFTVFGTDVIRAAAQGWEAGPPFPETQNPGALHIRLTPAGTDLRQPTALLLEFRDGSGTLLAIIPEFIGTVVVEENRVVSVNYTPASNSWRYDEYQSRAAELEEMKAAAAVASRQGQFVVEAEDAAGFADKTCHGKGLDPTLGLYAAYSYAQAGRYQDVLSVFTYMKEDRELPVPFDVVMLASHYQPAAFRDNDLYFAPFAPVLSQGWSLLMADHPMYRPIHGQLRPHLVPSLWTTYSPEGVEIIRKTMLPNPRP